VSRALSCWFARVGDGLEVLYFNCQVSQDRRRQREHCLLSIVLLAPGRYSEVFVRLGCQPLTLTPDRVIVGHAYRNREERDRLSAVGGPIQGDSGRGYRGRRKWPCPVERVIGFSG